MATNHDENGFLVGPKAADDLDKITHDIAILRAIRQDTQKTVATLGAIARNLGQSASRLPPEPSRSVANRRPSPVVIPLGPGMRQPSGPGAGQPGRINAADAANDARRPARAPRKPAEPGAAPARASRDTSSAQRDNKGRFLRGESSRADGPGSPPDAHSGSGGHQRLSAVGESARNAASGIAHGADGIDPSVQAAKELGGIVSPIAGAIKPLGRLFGMGRGGEDKRQAESVSWYRRIWNAVKGDKKGGGGNGLMMTALMGLLGMILAPIKALGRLLGGMRALAGLAGLAKGAARLAGLGGGRRGGAGAGAAGGGRAGRAGRGAAGAGSPVGEGAGPGRRSSAEARAARRAGAGPGAAAADAEAAAGAGGGRRGTRAAPGAPGGAAGGVRGAAGRVGGGLMSGAKGLLKKLPLIGALLGGAMIASDAMADDDPDLSPEENKKNKYANVGSGVGGMVGGVVGMLGGPAGAIAGAMIGDKLGEMVGTWLAGVDLKGIPDIVGKAFTSFKEGAVEMATGAFDSIKKGWSGLLDIGTKVFSSLGDTFSGMADWAKDTWNKATDAVSAVGDTIAEKYQDAKDYVGEKATSVVDSGKNLLNTATGGAYTGGSNAAKDQMIKAMDAGGITDPQSKAALMANVDHESGGFTKNEENLNYSAKRLREVFPKYYKTDEEAQADAGNKEAIANKVYGGRMGNTEAGDGYKYRGRGAIQLTGKAQYEEMGKKLGVDLVNNPDLAMDPKYSAQIAVQHWKTSGADKAAQAGDLVGARRKTNGGLNGLDDVQGKYGKYLEQAKAGDLTPARIGTDVRVQAPPAASSAIADTMAKVKGTAAMGVTPAAPASGIAGPAATGMGAGTVGIMAAPTTAPAPAGLNLGAPVSVASLAAPSYTAPAPDAGLMKLAPTPAVEKPMMAPSKPAANPTIQMNAPLTQTVDDRKIAHVAGGGISM
jgi:predicted chitinase